MKRIVTTFICLLAGLILFSQEETFYELPNQDRTVFERGRGDTVYVLEEHAVYNLRTDQYGCTKKDSVICKTLVGKLIVPPNYADIVRDSAKNDKYLHSDAFRAQVDYFHLWHLRGKSEVISSNKFQRLRTPENFLFSRTDFYQTIKQSVSLDGEVSFVSEIGPVEVYSPGWAIWILVSIVCILFLGSHWKYLKKVDSTKVKRTFLGVVGKGILLGFIWLIILLIVNAQGSSSTDGSWAVYQGISIWAVIGLTLLISVIITSVTVLIALLINTVKEYRQAVV